MLFRIDIPITNFSSSSNVDVKYNIKTIITKEQWLNRGRSPRGHSPKIPSPSKKKRKTKTKRKRKVMVF